MMKKDDNFLPFLYFFPIKSMPLFLPGNLEDPEHYERDDDEGGPGALLALIIIIVICFICYGVILIVTNNGNVRSVENNSSQRLNNTMIIKAP